MSRYSFNIPDTDPHGYQEINLGWDNPLNTFFYQLWKDPIMDDVPAVDEGCLPGDIPTIDDLVKKIQVHLPNFVMDESLRNFLVKDQETHDTFHRAPNLDKFLEQMEARIRASRSQQN